MNRLPIRWKAALLVGGSGLLLLTVLVPLDARRAADAAEHELNESIREEMGEAVGVIANGQSPALLGDSHASSSIRFVYQVLDLEGRVVASSEDGPAASFVREDGTPLAQPTDIVKVTEVSTGTPMRALGIALIVDGTTKTMVVAADASVISAARTHALWESLAIGLGRSLLIAAGTFLITGLVLRPVEKLRRSALDVADGVEGATIVIPTANDELRRLALAFDRTVREFEQSAAARDRFIAVASHELRTPVTKLRTELDLALRRPRSADEMRHALIEASRHTVRLARLVEQLLDLTRLQSATPPTMAPIDLDGVIADLLALYPRVTWKPTGLWVEGDPVTIGRAVQNLLDNALTHGQLPVSVSASRASDEIVIEVCDAGAGFDDDVMPMAGQTFGRSRAGGGAGLGLAIVAEIAAQHGGRLSFRHVAGTTTACLGLRASSDQ
ncbi:ATP-binding protein [soil metagenome]